MRCPYCKNPLTELAPECPACRLELGRARAILGPVPAMKVQLTDHTAALVPAEIKRIHKRIDRLERRFPQVRLQILVHHFPSEHPLELYVFWIFNAGGISSVNDKAGANHTVLLVLDPIDGKSSLMVGYGLEPFIDDGQLDDLLDDARLAWSDKAWAEGIMTVLDGLDGVLESSVLRIADAFDLSVRLPRHRAGDY